MTTFEKRSAGTAYDDHYSHQQRDNHQQRDSHHERDNHQQRAGLPTAGNVMSAWTIASYDYAEQVLKAQRQFFHSMLGATAPILDVARDVMSPDADEDRSARSQLDARSDQRHDGSNRSRKNERYNNNNNNNDTAEYNGRSVDSNRSDDNASDDNASDISRIERAKTQAEESAKTRARVGASAPDRKRL